MRVEFRRGAVTALTAALAIAIMSCGTGPSTASPAPAPPDPAADPDQRICQAYVTAAPGARTPLGAMRTQAVLVPFIHLIQLGTNQVAAQAGEANSPAVAGAMQELVRAQEDIDEQGRRALPPGADLHETPVRLDPTRLAAALDAADQVCRTVLTR